MRVRVKLEPELESIAGDLSVEQRRRMAVKLKRWAHQLEVTAFILERDAVPVRRLSVPRIRLEKATLN
jgi:hypothetical protein